MITIVSFVQLFKDRHVMVRVGGGWDTLEHYLIRHDPCRAPPRKGSDLQPQPPPQLTAHGRHSLSHSRSPTPDHLTIVRPRLPTTTTPSTSAASTTTTSLARLSSSSSASLLLGGSTPCLNQQQVSTIPPTALPYLVVIQMLTVSDGDRPNWHRC